MLFQGVKLLVINWRLTLVEILPAMWIWAAMLDLKVHVFQGKQFHILRGPVLVPILSGNCRLDRRELLPERGVRFRHRRPGKPEIRPAFARRTNICDRSGTGDSWSVGARVRHDGVPRWGKGGLHSVLSIVVGVMMLAYVAVPARLVGSSRIDPEGTSHRHRRRGRIGALVCSPPYALGGWPSSCRVAHLQSARRLLLVIAVVLQTGATTATKAIKFSAKLSPARGRRQSRTSPGQLQRPRLLSFRPLRRAPRQPPPTSSDQRGGGPVRIGPFLSIKSDR